MCARPTHASPGSIAHKAPGESLEIPRAPRAFRTVATAAAAQVTRLSLEQSAFTLVALPCAAAGSHTALESTPFCAKLSCKDATTTTHVDQRHSNALHGSGVWSAELLRTSGKLPRPVFHFRHTVCMSRIRRVEHFRWASGRPLYKHEACLSRSPADPIDQLLYRFCFFFTPALLRGWL